MAYYTQQQLKDMNFKSLGKNLKISDRASIYDCPSIEIGDNSRIDDFCVISGHISIGKNVHITPMCLLAGGIEGIVLEDYVTIAYGSKIFTQSDDYSGESMHNSTIPSKYKNEYKSRVAIERFSIIGAGSIIFPGIIVAEGTSLGAMSLLVDSTDEWSIYVGSPAQKIKSKSREILKLEKEYISKVESL